MTTEELVASWLDYLESSREGNDIPIMPAFVKKEDGTLAIMALDLPPKEIWSTVHAELAKIDSTEVIWGLDRFSLPDQGIDTSSLVTVYHWRRDFSEGYWGFKFGVVPYDENGCRPVIWDHPHWTKIQQGEIDHSLDKTRAAVSKLIADLGLPPETEDELYTTLFGLPRPITQEKLLAAVHAFMTRHRP